MPMEMTTNVIHQFNQLARLIDCQELNFIFG